MGEETPETCWATHKRQVINLWNCCILLVNLFETVWNCLHGNVILFIYTTQTINFLEHFELTLLAHYFRKFKIIPILATVLSCKTDKGNAKSLWLISNGWQKGTWERKGGSAVQRPNMLCGAQFNLWRQLLVLDTSVNTLRTRSFKLFKRPLPGFLTILTL